jgi:SAM-dependent methyltransferase
MMASVTDAPREYRLYHDLADWWPLISPLAEYADDVAVLEAVFGAQPEPIRTVLDLGSGGGNVAWHLSCDRELTLLDQSADMLAVSRQLNPQCEHVQGDMLTVRLGRHFDAVLVHDAVDYVTTEAELAMVAQTAFAHCRPGGIAVFMPDHTAETFRAGAGGGGSASMEDGRQASFSERRSDPDPADEWIQIEYEFTLRGADNRVQVVRESHRLGAFRHETWTRVLTAAGFAVSPGDRPTLFIGRRPRPASGPR